MFYFTVIYFNTIFFLFCFYNNNNNNNNYLLFLIITILISNNFGQIVQLKQTRFAILIFKRKLVIRFLFIYPFISMNSTNISLVLNYSPLSLHRFKDFWLLHQLSLNEASNVLHHSPSEDHQSSLDDEKCSLRASDSSKKPSLPPSSCLVLFYQSSSSLSGHH